MAQFKLSPAEARAKWVEALRSGEYQQSVEGLRDESGFCCLGVACDLFARVEGQGEWEGRKFSLDGRTDVNWLPGSVAYWLGVGNTDPIVSREGGHLDALSVLNDSGQPFSFIADLIDSGKLELADAVEAT